MKYHRPANSVSSENVDAAQATTRKVFISSEEGPNFALRTFTIGVGGEIPLHHNSVEHEQFVLEGQAEVVVGDESFIAREGDALLIPAGVKHLYRQQGDKPYRFICVVPNKKDILTLDEHIPG